MIEFLGNHGTGSNPEEVCELANYHEQVTVFCMDVVGFSTLTRECGSKEIMKLLNDLFCVFDTLCAVHGVHKVRPGFCSDLK